MTRYNAVCAALAAFALPQADHTHCVCGGNGDVNGHEHDTAVTWTTADSLPDSAGNYYLTQSVSGSWTVPTGEVNLCLNGQTISGSITVGSGATLRLTDCTGKGNLQDGVSVNGGTLELYGGTIIGGVEVGQHSNPATGSSFTMYGGAISGNNKEGGSGGGVFLVGTTNSNITAPRFTMHGGTISDNTAGASDGGGGGVYVGEKCSFTWTAEPSPATRPPTATAAASISICFQGSPSPAEKLPITLRAVRVSDMAAAFIRRAG